MITHKEVTVMMISSRGRYALRVLVDLAEQAGRDYVPMKEIAQRQGISLKYLERIIPVLSKNGFLEGIQGKGGGYRLLKDPEECRVGDILRLTEGDLAPVSCSECNGTSCDRAHECRTFPLWAEFSQVVNNYFDGKTLADLIRKPEPSATPN